MLVRQDDPAMLLVTMNEVVLQQVVGSLEARTEKIVARDAFLYRLQMQHATRISKDVLGADAYLCISCVVAMETFALPCIWRVFCPRCAR